MENSNLAAVLETLIVRHSLAHASAGLSSGATI
jgi:hypothetical protein